MTAHATLPARPRVGLVLGAGGITGIAWLAGALRAIRARTGWEPADADIVSGTSAGAIAGAVLAAGHDPAGLLRYAEEPEALEAAIAAATGHRRPDGRAIPLPGSLGLVAEGLLARDVRRRLVSLSGLVPRGVRSADEIRGLTHEACRGGWPTRTELWLHACDMRSGELVTFGRAGAPQAPLADAVVASCAVPGYYRPVQIGERRYVDGGVHSLANAGELAGAGCDIVVVLSPFATRERGPLVDTAVFGAARAAAAAHGAREVRRLREDGVRVATIAAGPEDIRAMGLNPMDRARSREVLETAERSVAARLGGVLDELGVPAAPLRRAA